MGRRARSFGSRRKLLKCVERLAALAQAGVGVTEKRERHGAASAELRIFFVGRQAFAIPSFGGRALSENGVRDGEGWIEIQSLAALVDS